MGGWFVGGVGGGTVSVWNFAMLLINGGFYFVYTIFLAMARRIRIGQGLCCLFGSSPPAKRYAVYGEYGRGWGFGVGVLSLRTCAFGRL